MEKIINDYIIPQVFNPVSNAINPVAIVIHKPHFSIVGGLEIALGLFILTVCFLIWLRVGYGIHK